MDSSSERNKQPEVSNKERERHFISITALESRIAELERREVELRQEINIEGNHYKKRCEILEYRLEESDDFLTKINNRQEYLFEEADKLITKDNLEEAFKPLIMSTDYLKKPLEDIVSKLATKDDIITAIGNLQVTRPQNKQQRPTIRGRSGW